MFAIQADLLGWQDKREKTGLDKDGFNVREINEHGRRFVHPEDLPAFPDSWDVRASGPFNDYVNYGSTHSKPADRRWHLRVNGESTGLRISQSQLDLKGEYKVLDELHVFGRLRSLEEATALAVRVHYALEKGYLVYDVDRYRAMRSVEGHEEVSFEGTRPGP